MGDWSAGAQYPLWYAHYDHVATFDDFKPFGGWKVPYMKQYIGTTTEQPLTFSDLVPDLNLKAEIEAAVKASRNSSSLTSNVHTLVYLDCSGSMSGENILIGTIMMEKILPLKFLGKSKVMFINDRKIAHSSSPITWPEVETAWKKNIAGLTRLWQSVHEDVMEHHKSNPSTQFNVIVTSDGEDNCSKDGFEGPEGARHLLSELKKVGIDISFYIVGIRQSTQGTKMFEAVSGLTGGSYINLSDTSSVNSPSVQGFSNMIQSVGNPVTRKNTMVKNKADHDVKASIGLAYGMDTKFSSPLPVMTPKEAKEAANKLMDQVMIKMSQLIPKMANPLQGELSAKSGGAPTYKGFVRGSLQIFRDEGIVGLYKGIAPSLLREATYSTLRMGGYDAIKSYFVDEHGKTSLLAKVASGAASGSIGACIANPTDLVKVRMQASRGSPRYTSVVDAFRSIYKAEGLAGLYKGVGPTTQRAALLTASQLSSYDAFKHRLLDSKLVNEGLAAHTLASVAAGLVAAIVTSPVDTVKTRIMSQPIDAQGKGLLYKSTIDCIGKTIKSEGMAGLYKGFIPNWVRIGPHTIVTFIVYENLRKLGGIAPV
eukprot:gene2443-2778_t